MEPGVKKHDVPVDSCIGPLLRCFKIRDIDLAEVWNVGQIQADGFAHEHVQRHFINRLAILTHMEKGVDVSANMINHADESGCAPQLIARDSDRAKPSSTIAGMVPAGSKTCPNGNLPAVFSDVNSTWKAFWSGPMHSSVTTCATIRARAR